MSIPHPQTCFVGRAADLARVRALYAARASIVTLWGPPGIGKTRLAIEVCHRGALRRAGEPEARVWFCDLTAARDATEVFTIVARALDGTGRSPPTTPGRISAALTSAAPGILVLDNFEHLSDHAEEIVGAWAAAAPHICFLATSRERLRLAGEVVHEVLPLGDEAAELFADRARAWSGLVAPLRSDVDAILSLVSRLEGIPLAIELAASRIDVLGLDGLASQLDRRLDVLARAPRDLAPNHATLRQAIDSSYAALSAAEKRALAECSVFRGGFTLQAAEGVLTTTAPVPLLDVLQSLRDRSLLRCLPEGGEVRFAFFETIRAYAAERLAVSGEEDAVRARHAQHYLAARSPSFTDHENLADAATHAVSASVADAPVVLPEALIAALARIDPCRAPHLLVDRFDPMLAMAGRQGWPPRLLATGHRIKGRALQLRGRLAEARLALERAVAIGGGDDAVAAEIWDDLGLLHHQCRRVAEARACYERALALHEGLDDAQGRARTLGHLGALHHDTRQYDEAVDHYDRALASFRAAGDSRGEANYLTNKGVLLQERGAFGAARKAYLAALARIAPLGDRRLEGIALTNLGFLDHEDGNLEGASANHQRALARFREIVDPCSEGLCLGRLAMAAAALGRREDARGYLLRAERLLAHIEDPLALGVLRVFEVFVDATADSAVEAEVRERLDEVRGSSIGDGVPLVELSDDARTAARLTEGLLAARWSRARTGILVVGPSACWFTPPDGDTCDLAQRDVLRRLFLRLVEQHRFAPSEGLSLDALREAGWPCERILESAATNRIHVALTELRRRGLRRCLIRKRDKYLLDPALRVVLSDG